MSKFHLYLLVQISKALVNSEIQFLIQKFFFLAFGPTDLAAHSAIGPTGPASLSPLVGQIQPCRPSQPVCRWRICGSTFSFLVHAFRAVRFVFLHRRPTVFTPSRRLRPPRAAWPPTSRCQARSSLHTLIPPLNFTP
jgi:hypothetical protein